MQEILDRKIIIAQQFGIYLDDEAELFDFFYLSSEARKQKTEKIKAIKEGKIWV